MQAAGNLLGSSSSGVQLQYAIVDRALGHLTDVVQGFVAYVNGLIDSSGAPLPAVDPSPEEEGLPEQSMSLAPRQSRRARDRAKEVADESAATRGRCDRAHGCIVCRPRPRAHAHAHTLTHQTCTTFALPCSLPCLGFGTGCGCDRRAPPFL